MKIMMIKNSVGVSRSDGAATMTYEANKEYNSSEAWQEKVFKYFVKNGLANEIGGNAPVPETKAPKRARNEKGQLKGDDPTTPNVNEAWEGGKAPQK
tara:strand:- start:22114 stop:22404 length:291 start_codon:yes stop_codon:yes gene_type:complete